jgi:hypothetical protein
MTDSSRVREVVLVGSTGGSRKATHTGGYQAISDEKLLPIADVLLLIVDDDPGAMLFRYTTAGEFGGDTWHPTVDQARAQAEFEYGEALLVPWLPVPDDVENAHDFAIRYALDRLKDRGRWPAT